MIFALPAPQLIEIHGSDAIAFANAQFCNDVLTLHIGAWHYNAWLNTQGRVHALFALLRPQADTLIMVLRGGQATPISTDLARYKFRSKVTIRSIPDWRAFALNGTQAIADNAASDLFTGEPGAKKLLQLTGLFGIAPPGANPRVLLLAEPQTELAVENVTHPEHISAWDLADIRAGLPQLAAATSDQFLPQALGLEQLQAMSFNKGCYPGQEVVARIHFKGGNKRHLYRIEFAAADCPAAGTNIYTAGDDQQPAGMLLQSANVASNRIIALAVLRQDATAGSLHVAGAGSVLLATKC